MRAYDNPSYHACYSPTLTACDPSSRAQKVSLAELPGLMLDELEMAVLRLQGFQGAWVLSCFLFSLPGSGSVLIGLAEGEGDGREMGDTTNNKRIRVGPAYSR